MTKEDIKNDIFPYLAQRIRQYLIDLDNSVFEKLYEIRLGVNKPVTLVCDDGVFFVNKDSAVSRNYINACLSDETDIEKTLELMTKSSVYSFLDDVKKGFITLDKGYRVGLCGHAVLDNDNVSYIKDISYLNIRIKREVKGCSNKIIDKIVCNGEVKNTLIAGPVQSGKTTLIRDIAKNLSDLFSKRVSIADERGEIAAVKDKIFSNDVGILTSVMDFCPKKEAMAMLIRSMAPEVIITDEIGSDEDICEIKKALKSGVKIITTCHANSYDDIKMYRSVFDLIILLDGTKKGEVKEIFKGDKNA